MKINEYTKDVIIGLVFINIGVMLLLKLGITPIVQALAGLLIISSLLVGGLMLWIGLSAKFNLRYQRKLLQNNKTKEK